MIDKGKSELSAVKTVIPNTFVASLAKREERLFCDCFPDGIILEKHSTKGLLIIFICNYKHNFAFLYDQKLE